MKCQGAPQPARGVQGAPDVEIQGFRSGLSERVHVARALLWIPLGEWYSHVAQVWRVFHGSWGMTPPAAPARRRRGGTTDEEGRGFCARVEVLRGMWARRGVAVMGL